MRLLGRDAELARTSDLLDLARSGRSGALLVRGDAGTGKTALLAAVTRQALAAGFHTRDLRGVAGEADFGFAALQRLLTGSMDGYADLPVPQRQALGAALGLTDTGPPDRFLVGLATLTLLAETQPDRAKLVVVDDAHWLDQESLDTLVFVARRIEAESLALVLGTRPDSTRAGTFDGIATLDLAGLSATATTELLATTSGATVDPEVGRRVAAGTRGCPLAVVELARDLSPGQLVGTIALPDPLPIGDRLEALYLARVRALPAATQQLLLVAAADTVARLATVVSAGELAGLGADALDAARTAGLVDVGTTVTFRHPLVRSAVYRAAAPADQRQAHAWLAAVTDPGIEPDAWVWHRAKSVAGTDEDVAAALETRGRDAERRGRYAAYAALMSRAAELTPDPVVLARRAQTAATALLVAGAQREAGALLDQVRVEHAEPLVRAQAQRLRAVLTYIGRPVDALATLVETARSLEDLDPHLAQVTYAEGLFLAAVTGRFAPPGLTDRLVRSALAAPPPEDPSPYAEVVQALAARLTGDFATAAPLMRRVVDWLSQHDAPQTFTLSSQVGALLAVELFDIEAYRRITTRHAAEQRSRGALDLLRVSVQAQAHSEFVDGRFDEAATLYAEAGEISRSIGDDRVAYRMIIHQQLGVWRDDEATSRENLQQVQTLAVTEVRSGFWERMAHETLAILENSLGNYAAALDAAWPVLEQDPVLSGPAFVEAVEAAHRCGQDERAATALDLLGARARACGTPWATGLHERSTAVVAGDDAEPHFRRALDALGQVPVRTEVARTHLLYGEWLRRQHRRKDARAQLTTAHDLFTAMGAPHFAARTARELAATGATVRRRRPVPGTEPLTPQERAIARLAAGPATNREIAASMFLSASTVDYHLRKVYRKLGVDSRRRLADALGEQ